MSKSLLPPFPQTETNHSSLPLGSEQCYVFFNPDLTIDSVFHHRNPENPAETDPLSVLEEWAAPGLKRRLSEKETPHGTAIIIHAGTSEERILGYYTIVLANPKHHTVHDRGAW